MNGPVKIAIVGLGRAGWGIHALQLRGRPDFRVVAVASSDAARRNEAMADFHCEAYVDLKSLLKKSAAEVVVIATPSSMHESDALQVLNSGRHCILEKPMAMSHAGAKQILATTTRKRRKLFMHHSCRFSPEYCHLREILDSGVLGHVFEIRACWTSFARRNDWQTLRKNGGGILNNNGPHILDQTLAFLDAPVVSLLGDLQHLKDPGDGEDHAHVFIKAENGRVADITLSSVCALPLPKWMFLGSCGTLSTDGTTTTLRYFDPKKVSPLKVVDGPAPGRAFGNDDKLPWVEKNFPTQPTVKYPSFYDNVADVLLRNKPMFATPPQAVEVVRISEWVRKGTKFTQPIIRQSARK